MKEQTSCFINNNLTMNTNSKFNDDGYCRVKVQEDMPTEPHYAVIEYASTYIPGDERSCTDPGHGYGPETIQYVNYIVFKDRKCWEIYIKLKGARAVNTINPVFITPAKINVQTTVDINLPVWLPPVMEKYTKLDQ